MTFINFIHSIGSSGGDVFIFFLGLVVLQVKNLDQIFGQSFLSVLSVVDSSK